MNGRLWSTTPSSFIANLKADDGAAWQRLCHLTAPVIYYWCRRAGLSESDTDIVGSDVMLAIVRYIPTFRPTGPGAFRAWLRSIVRTNIVNFFRQRDARQLPEGGSSALRRMSNLANEEATDEEIRTESRLLYDKAVEFIQGEFSGRDWKVFRAVVIEGRPSVDVADERDITVNTVYLVKSRILKRLRDEFGPFLT